MTVDLHQHVWTTPLLNALARRDRLPFVRRTDGLTVLHGGGELPYVIDTDAESADRRAPLLAADGLRRAVVALSSPIGIEELPHDAAAELISAHLEGVLALGDGFAAWGPIPVHDPDPADVDEVLRRGCAGVSVPACALAGRHALDALGAVLERVQAHARGAANGAAVVARSHRLRLPDAGGVADLRHSRPARAAPADRGLRHARRRRAAAVRTPGLARGARPAAA